MLIVEIYWLGFRREVQAQLEAGQAQANLVNYFVNFVTTVLRQADVDQLVTALGQARLAHPLDSHPTLIERCRSLKVDLGPVVAECVRSMSLVDDRLPGTEAIERKLSQMEIERFRIPGTAVTVLENS